MSRLLLTISYLGTNYCGWQVQPNGVSVQQTLQDALQKLYGVRFGVTGCSRTDSGVHANMFCCHFDTDSDIEPKSVVKALNHFLPKDISAIDCNCVDSDFHARYSCKGKNYIYRIYNNPCRNPFEEGRALHIGTQLDDKVMNEFCNNLVGKFDFSVFSSSGTGVSNFVRTITECNASRNNDIITLSVSADGFLYNMVRIIVGTALQAAYGKIKPCDALDVINSKDRNLAGPTAAAAGLYLNKVFY